MLLFKAQKYVFTNEVLLCFSTMPLSFAQQVWSKVGVWMQGVMFFLGQDLELEECWRVNM
jgi:hypothetical protein